MNISDSFLCIYNNIICNFYIALNMFFPLYGEDILKLQYRTIECINDNIIFECNTRKRRRFNIFVENLIVKNNELIEKIKRQEEEDNNLENYEQIQEEDGNESNNEEDQDYSQDSQDEEDSQNEDTEEDKKNI